MEEGGGFSCFGEPACAFFFEEKFAVFANLKDTTLSGDEGDVLVAHGFDFGRHPVGFWEVVSLRAIFDLDHVGEKMGGFSFFANEKLLRL